MESDYLIYIHYTDSDEEVHLDTMAMAVELQIHGINFGPGTGGLEDEVKHFEETNDEWTQNDEDDGSSITLTYPALHRVSCFTDQHGQYNRDALRASAYEMSEEDLLLLIQDLDQELAALEASIINNQIFHGPAERAKLAQIKELTKEVHEVNEQVRVLMLKGGGAAAPGRRTGPRWCWTVCLMGAALVLGIESLIPRVSNWFMGQERADG